MQRRAFRALSSSAIDRDTVERLLTAASLAPSCMNKQPWRFVVADREPVLQELKDKALEPGNYWARLAPVIIAVVTQADLDCRLSEGRDYALFDTGMAAMNLMLQATAEGLYAHPIAGFKPVEAKTILGIPDDHILVTLVICGRPADSLDALNDRHRQSETAERGRKPLSDISSFNGWQFAKAPTQV